MPFKFGGKFSVTKVHQIPAALEELVQCVCEVLNTKAGPQTTLARLKPKKLNFFSQEDGVGVTQLHYTLHAHVYAAINCLLVPSAFHTLLV